MGAPSRRPGPVTFLAAINIVVGALMLLVVAAAGYSGLVALLAPGAAASLAIGYGLLRGWRWAWWLEVAGLAITVVWGGLWLLWNAYMAATTPGVEGYFYGDRIPFAALRVIMAGVFLRYMLGPEARGYFGVEWPPGPLRALLGPSSQDGS